jgi:hypothetical protein
MQQDQEVRSTGLRLLAVWVGFVAYIGIGFWVVSIILDTTRVPARHMFSNDGWLLLADLVLTLIGLFVVTSLAYKIVHKAASNDSVAKKQQGIIFIAMAGVILGFFGWNNGVNGPSPIMLPTVLVVGLLQMVILYWGIVRFRPNEPNRTSRIFLFMSIVLLIVPMVLMYLSAHQQTKNYEKYPAAQIQ